ncbi:DNA-formamidopyrimidine glycosylase family protein [Galbitalea sp. SE-J8]|uniref:DNA-formamidopyrimidine glycosylase family protein n=1 Tax=Galbitalea sp. SE-J8 TaxID=3054952 RepID=UPI00259C989A|nr:DNA-formamidopyrimidine glycosylase family protein [Galbitalea sp. SE-J8]MDM4762639.1 DNA-formamidopyrimidine glycosylase family protein [Galbitalea sp. SE-J8]
MPELPEVTALVADLSSRLIGRRIRRLQLVSFAALKTFDPPVSALDGGTVTGVDRHGKYLDVVVAGVAGDELHLVFHLARAGWLRWRSAAPSPIRGSKGPIAARLELEPDAAADPAAPAGRGGDGFDLTEAGTKKSLTIHVVHAPADVERIATLGPDPLDPAFTVDVLAGILRAAGRSQLKGVLRDQRRIAGIGNAYSDEILHVAKLSPFARAAETDAAHLHAAIRQTLHGAITRADGLAASELKAEKKSNLRVHGRFGQACPVCGDTIQQVIYADSTFQYCPTCQTGGRKLSDRVMDRLLK